MKSNKLLRAVGLFLAVCLLFLVSPQSTAPVSADTYTDNMRIKVGLAFGSTAQANAALFSDGGFVVINANEETGEYTDIASISETAINVKNSGGKAMIYSSSGALLYSGSETLYLRSGSGYINYSSHSYLEIMKLYCKDGLLRVINIISLENYIKGVLPREIYPSWPDEALKSAAIVARSFAISSLKGKHKSYDVDVCTTTCCQVFGGNGSNEHARTNAAVDATKNIVLAYGDKVALTVYTSSCGDSTESAAGAWGGSEERYPYLCGVQTPFETPEEYPNGKWSYTFTPAELKEYLNTKSAYAGKLTGDIVAIDCEYGSTGYVRKITVSDSCGNSVSASTSDGVRNMLWKYLKSSKFTVTPHFYESGSTVSVQTANGIQQREAVPYGAYVLRADSEQPVPLYENYIPLYYTIDGTGYGHGVGLSQFGAMTLAKSGKTHDEILATYFPGTYLTSLGALGLLSGLGEIGEMG